MMEMHLDDLAVFILFRLDEDERVALDWQRHKQALTDRFMNDPSRKRVQPRREPVTDAQLSEYAYNSRFDPEHVLREVEAKRKMIQELMQRYRACWDVLAATIHGKALRDVLLGLALPYADHPDYQESWRP